MVKFSFFQGPDMLVARDAAAWALEGDHLFVLGGVLGKLSGYTDSVEMYDLTQGVWDVTIVVGVWVK